MIGIGVEQRLDNLGIFALTSLSPYGNPHTSETEESDGKGAPVQAAIPAQILERECASCRHILQWWRRCSFRSLNAQHIARKALVGSKDKPSGMKIDQHKIISSVGGNVSSMSPGIPDRCSRTLALSDAESAKPLRGVECLTLQDGFVMRAVS